MSILITDFTTPDSSQEICNYLYKNLSPILKCNRPIIFLCIGSDRSTGDALGPLIGNNLRTLKTNNIYIYGSLETPVHAKNLSLFIDKINSTFLNPYIVAIDASLGEFKNLGKIFIEKKPLFPGLALKKDIPPIGNMSITGIVNISGNFEFMILQNTRLSFVMKLADCISQGISKFIIMSNKKLNLK